MEAVYSYLSEDGAVEERKAPIPSEQLLAEGKFLDEETMVFRSSFQVYVYDLNTDSVKYQLPKMEDAIQALMVIDRKIFCAQLQRSICLRRRYRGGADLTFRGSGEPV